MRNPLAHMLSAYRSADTSDHDMSSPIFSPTDLVLVRQDGPGGQFTIVESRGKRERNPALGQNFAQIRTTS